MTSVKYRLQFLIMTSDITINPRYKIHAVWARVIMQVDSLKITALRSRQNQRIGDKHMQIIYNTRISGRYAPFILGLPAGFSRAHARTLFANLSCHARMGNPFTEI